MAPPPVDPSHALVALGLVGGLATFVLHPLWVWLASRLFGERPVDRGDRLPSVSAIVAFHGRTDLVVGKVADLLAIDYPIGLLEVILVSDGPMPDPGFLPPEFAGRGWKLLATGAHEGKTNAINLGVTAAGGEVLLFTDPDGRLGPETLRALVSRFTDPEVGGVCGRRIVVERDTSLDDAQADYISFDTWIKALESRRGFLTSNDGKLYAMRRALFAPIPAAVTDDLYNGLAVARQGFRMVFAADAVVSIPKPSRNPRHELARRRRIVGPSLYGIYLHRALLNPFRHGAFAVALLLNKVVRRLLPLFLALVLAGSAAGAPDSVAMAVLLAAQCAGYGAAALYLPLTRWRLPSALARALGLTFYFVVGNLGMAMGLIDFLRGRRINKWTPLKSDT